MQRCCVCSDASCYLGEKSGADTGHEGAWGTQGIQTDGYNAGYDECNSKCSAICVTIRVGSISAVDGRIRLQVRRVFCFGFIVVSLLFCGLLRKFFQLTVITNRVN
eukprot:PhF_6_TR26399/c0_g1_i2/m.38136